MMARRLVGVPASLVLTLWEQGLWGCAGYESISVLMKCGAPAPLRVGLWRLPGINGNASGHYVADPLLCAVEPLTAQLLELPRLANFGAGLSYAPSRNRQCHTYTVTERRDARSLALKRVFVRWAKLRT